MSSGRLAAPNVSRKKALAAWARASASSGVASRIEKPAPVARRSSPVESVLNIHAGPLQGSRMLLRNEKEGQREEQVYGEQHHTLEPGRLTVLRDRVDDERRAGDRDQLDRILEDEVHRMADEIRDDHKQRRDEEADLNRGSSGDPDDETHLAAAREVHGRDVLGSVADDGEHDHAEKERCEAKPGSRC